MFERRNAGGHRQRVSGERSGLVDRAERREEIHHIGASAKCADGQAAADDLAQRGEVGRAVELVGK